MLFYRHKGKKRKWTMAIGERIKSRREELGLTQQQLADRLGYKSKSAINKIELGVNDIAQKRIVDFAKALNTSIEYLLDMDKKDSEEKPQPVRIPVLGRIAAGIPLEMIEDVVDWEEIDAETAKLGPIFALKVEGHSMEPRILDGDVVIIHQQEDAESGDIVIASVNGDDATCKRLRKFKDGIELVPNNPAYAPMFFSNQEIVSKPVRIIGKVIELRGKF